MNNKIIITKKEKNEIKARLYYTYSFLIMELIMINMIWR